MIRSNILLIWGFQNLRIRIFFISIYLSRFYGPLFSDSKYLCTSVDSGRKEVSPEEKKRENKKTTHERNVEKPIRKDETTPTLN